MLFYYCFATSTVVVVVASAPDDGDDLILYVICDGHFPTDIQIFFSFVEGENIIKRRLREIVIYCMKFRFRPWVVGNVMVRLSSLRQRFEKIFPSLRNATKPKRSCLAKVVSSFDNEHPQTKHKSRCKHASL